MAKNTKTFVGGNLWQISAQYLGDATQANRIATRTGILDPFLTGVQTVSFPPTDASAGGGEPFGPITDTATTPEAFAPTITTVPVTPPGIPFVPPPPPIPAEVDNPQPKYAPWLSGVVLAWAPADPMPTLAGKLPPALSAVRVNQAPSAHRGRGATTNEVIWNAWIPPDPLPNLGTNLAPSIMDVVVNLAPSAHRGRGATTNEIVLNAWIPPDPLPNLGTNLAPSIMDVPVNVAPPANRGRGATTNAAILAAWTPPDPLPTPQRLLPAQVTVPVVNPPPPHYAPWQPTVLAAWQPAPPMPNIGMSDPDGPAWNHGVESPSPTIITTIGPVITDSSSGTWSLVASTGPTGLAIQHNGVTQSSTVSGPPVGHGLEPVELGGMWQGHGLWMLVPGRRGNPPTSITAAPVELAYSGHVVFYEDASGNWYFWNGSIWVATVSPFVVIPSAPQSVGSSSVTTSIVNLTWLAPASGSGVSSYHVQYGVSPATINGWLDGPTVAGLAAQITGLASGTAYDFHVNATGTAGTGPYSPAYTVSTTAAAPTVAWNPVGASPTITFSPDHLTATAGGSSVALSTHQDCLSTTALVQGTKGWFQVTLTNLTQNTSIGLVNSSFVTGDPAQLGGDANGIGYYPSTGAGAAPAQSIFYSGGALVLGGIGATTFDDEFATFITHVAAQAGDNWGYCSPDSPNGRGGTNNGETINQWWLNPLNPFTPISGVYAQSNGVLTLGVVNTPAAYQAYINAQAGQTMNNYTAALLYSNLPPRQLFGYFEVTASVDAIPGFVFQVSLETFDNGWPPEIDMLAYTNSDGSQHVVMKFDNPTGPATAFTSAAYDITLLHKYATDWQANAITFYIDDVQVFTTPNPGGNYQSLACGMYLLTIAGDNGPDVSPNPASLPAHARVHSVRWWNSRPIPAASDVAGATVTGLVDLTTTPGALFVTSPSMRTTYGPLAWNDNASANPSTGAGSLPINLTGNLSICFDNSEAGAVGVLNATSAPVGGVAIPSTFPSWTGVTQTVTVPGVINTLAAGTTTSSSIMLSCAAPTGTAPFTYHWLSRPSGSGSFTQFATTNNVTSITNTGLPVSSPFDFQVFASNSAGSGAVSNTVTASTTALLSVPNQGATPAFVSATSTSVTVSYADVLTGAVPTGHQLQYKVSGPGAFLNAPQWLESRNGTAITPSTGSIVDTLGNTFAISAGGQIVINAVVDGTTSSVTGSKYWAHKFYQVNASNNWYVNNGGPGNWTQVAGDPALTIAADNTFTQTVTGLVASTSYVFQDFAFNAAGNGPTSATGTGSTTAAVAGGAFSVSGGKVMRNGSPFIARGVSNYIIDPVSGNPQTTDFATISRCFPGINAFKAVISQHHTSGDVTALVNDWTSHGCVIILANYIYGAGAQINSGNFPADAAMFSDFGAAFKNNPLVWYSSSNEATSGGTGSNLSDDHRNVYNAVRNAGGNNIITFDVWGGSINFNNNPPAYGMIPSYYNNMTNVAWDHHPYFNFNPGGSLATVIAAYQAITTTLDGQMPVHFGEFGDGGSGSSNAPDSAGLIQGIVNACAGNGIAGTVGFSAWIYDNWGVQPSNMLQTNNQVYDNGDHYAPTVAAAIAAGATTVTPQITGITLSNNAFLGGAASGTVIGSISVAMNTGAFTGTLSLSGTNVSNFQLSSTTLPSNLETNGVVAAGGPYAVNIIATQAGATGSPFTQPESITGTTALVPGAPTLTVGSTSNTSVTFGITPPSTGGAIDAGGYQPRTQIGAGAQVNATFIPVITAGQGSFTALGGTWSVTVGGLVAFTGAGGPGTSSGVTEMTLVNGTVWQFNGTNWYGTTTPGSWPLGGNPTSPLSSVNIPGLVTATAYKISASAQNSTGTGPFSAQITETTTTTAAGAFTVSGGVLLKGGNPFLMKGVAILPDANPPSAATIQSKIPGCNALNWASGQYNGNGFHDFDPPTNWYSQIDAYLAAGLIVMISDYTPGAPNVRSGQDATNAFAWYAAIATHYKTNPNVMFTTQNEPNDPDNGASIDAYHKGVYNAVRNTAGNSVAMIWFESSNSNHYPTYVGPLNASTYNNMTLVGWNIHQYPWTAKRDGLFVQGTTQAQFNTYALSVMPTYQNFTHSLDGVMPCIMGEGGNASDGNTYDDFKVNNKDAVVESYLEILRTAFGGFSGVFPWLWNYGGGGTTGSDQIVDNNGNIVPMGSQVAARYAQTP